jgi:hypothetical protein
LTARLFEECDEMGSKIKELAGASRGKILSMEHRLSGVLRPINPRNEFIHGVARHIRETPRVTLVDRITNWHLTAILIAALVSLAVFLALLGRALLTLLGKERPIRI